MLIEFMVTGILALSLGFGLAWLVQGARLQIQQRNICARESRPRVGAEVSGAGAAAEGGKIEALTPINLLVRQLQAPEMLTSTSNAVTESHASESTE
jgi:hypothetical protein